MSKDDVDKLEDQEMKTISSIKQNVMGEKPKIIRDKLKDKIMIFGHFLKPKKKKIEEKKQNEKKIKNKIITDVRTLFQQEGGCYEPKRVSNFWNNNWS